MHLDRPRGEASTRSKWWSIRKSKLPSESQPASARCTISDEPVPITQPQAIPDLTTSSSECPKYRIDSLGPLKISDSSTKDSGPSQQLHGSPTAQLIQHMEPLSAPFPATLRVDDTFQAAVVPNDVLPGSKPQAASSSTRYDPEISTGRLFYLFTPCSQPLHEVATGLHEDHLVTLQIPTYLEAEEDEGTDTQAARDYVMAVSLQEEEDRRHAAEMQPPSRDCTVCCESLHPLQFPAKPPLSECLHVAEVCFPCLQQWVAARVDANARAAIDCPQCTTPLSHDDVRRACNFETFAKYDRFSTLTVVDGLQDFHWCLRPGCTSGQEHINRELEYMKCYACDYEQCL
jgi:hypothetical protein